MNGSAYNINKLHFKENHSSSYTIFRHGALKHDWRLEVDCGQFSPKVLPSC